MESSDDIINHLIEAINSFNPDETAYWIRMIMSRMNKDKDKDSLIADSIPLNHLFSAFSLNDPDLSNLLSTLIFDLVHREDFPIISQKYKTELLSGLESSQEAVNNLCLNIIFQLGFFKNYPVQDDFIKPTLNLIFSKNFQTSSLLIKYLTKLNSELVAVKFVNPLLELFTCDQSSQDDSVVQFRFLELFLALESGSNSSLTGSNGSNQLPNTSILLDSFIINLTKTISNVNDPLLCVNGLQTVLDCINSEKEFSILNNNGIMELLLSMLTALPSNSNNPSIICKIFEIFSECSVKRLLPVEFVSSKGLDVKVLDYIDSDEVVITSSAIICAASIATLDISIHSFTAKILDKLYHGSSYVQIASLHALGIFFGSSSLTSQDKLDFLLKLNNYTPIFDWLSERVMSNFDEQKNATYFALSGIISFSDGLKFGLDNSSIISSSLLRRDLDDSVSGLKWKYGIIENITKSNDLFALLNEPLQEQFRKYLGQGVFFVPTMTRVVFETAD